jgi:diguanylate cyclase (GGDEF)-like protein/PAS domain S-box-containing protein
MNILRQSRIRLNREKGWPLDLRCMNKPLTFELSANSQRELMLEMLLSELDGMVYRCLNDEHWTMEFISDGCFKLTGYQPAELLDNAVISYEEITHPDDRQHIRGEVNRALQQHSNFSVEYRLLHADGSIKWVWERGSAADSGNGHTQVIHGFIVDITQRYLHEKALLEAERRYRSIFENANEGIFQTTQDGHYLAVNPALAAIYGYDSPQHLINALVDIGQQLYIDAGRRAEFTALLAATNSVSNFESQVYRKDRSVIWISENAHVVHDIDGEILYYEGTVEDITTRKRYEQQITHQATHDELTGLPNRTLLAQRIEHAILETASTGSSFAVVFLDLDHFKTINDTMGHAAGDVLIRKVAERLAGVLRDGDTVARIGGDEFVLLLRGVQKNCGTISQIIERVLAVIHRAFMLGDREITIGCSLGITLHPEDGMDADTLLKHADIAMYQAKEAGRNNYQFFTQEFNRLVQENYEIEQQLRRALAAPTFEMYYQPIVSAGSGALIKAEALLRWHTPELGFISPARFIPIAENTGLIEPLGLWVLDAVCKQLAQWLQQGIRLPVAINISPRQFNQPALIQTIESRLLEHGVPANLLDIEITENCLARDKKKFLQTLAQMKALGLTIAIDDFGSGYSNMDCLRTMQFSTLKIDRSFIMQAEADNNHGAIYRALISLAHNLNMKVVAEGVETQQQADFLRQIGCDLIQGFLYSKPLPAAQFEAFYRHNLHEQSQQKP